MSNRKFRRALLCAAASVGLCSSAYSQTSTWTHAGDGTFNVAGNWAGGVPGATGTALFSLGNTYTVTFNANASNAMFNFFAGNVTFASSGGPRVYSQTGSDGVSGGILTLSGISVSSSAGFDVANLGAVSLLNSANLSASGTDISEGTITVSGSTYSTAASNSLIGHFPSGGASFVLQNDSAGTLGFVEIGGLAPSTSGALSVQSGSSITLSSVVIGVENITGETGVFTVSSASGTSTATQTSASMLTIGGTISAGTLAIGAGGSFSSGTGTLLVNALGSINMTGGTLNLNNATVLLNGNLKQTTGAINLASGQRFTIQNGGVATLGSNLTAPAGGTFTVTGANSRADLSGGALFINSGATGSISAGGSVTNSGGVIIGSVGAGTSNLTVDGGTISGAGELQSFIGISGSAGRLTLLNHASVAFPVSLDLGGAGTNSFGLVTINSGTLTVGALFVAATGGTNVTGEIDLTGAAASMALSGVATVGGIGGAGTISVSSGTFDTGNGNLMINNGGTVSVTGGSFRNNGAIFVDGSLTVNGSDYVASTLSALNVEANGVASFSNFTFLNGNNTVGGISASLHTVSAAVNSGTLTANPGGTYIATNTLNLGAVANINGGTFSLGGLADFDTGTFNFNSGTLIFTGSQQFDPPTATKVLGAARTLLPGRNLIFSGDCALTSDLTVDGGNLAIGALDSGGTLLSLKTGTFSLNSTTLTVGTNGQLGNTLTIGPNMTVNTHQANIGTNGLVVINGGVFSASVETFVNPQGEIDLTSPSATLSAPGAQLVNSGGLIHGTGQILALVSNNSAGIVRASTGERLVLDAGFANSGTMSLLGGEIDSLVPSINQNGGVITGRGEMLFHGLTNTATIALSAGLSDFTGTLTNNATVIITGGGTATFYDTVANSPGSQFRVSTNSTAVFLGNVTGLAAFAGNGIKDFEGSASGGAIVTSGSSIVGGGSSLAADSIREVALDVIGSGKITPNGTSTGTSRVQSLTIDGTTDDWDGKLDLSNNAMVIDYTGASPIATIANQIKSAFHGGDWQGKGITSSIASNFIAHPTALGYAEASAVGFTSSFLGQSTDDTSVLIRYVFSGDANLDGVVNALDFNTVAGNFGSGGKFWNDGDFNYDGVTSTADFMTLAQNFSQTLPSPALGSVVPEPAMTLVLWALFPRRRRASSPATRGSAIL